MRKLLPVLGALAAAACGSDTKSSSGVSGTIGGAAFKPADVGALSLGPKSCTLPNGFGTINAAVVAIQFASTANVCADLISTSCVAHANSQGATVFIANAPLTGDASLTPGVYSVVADPSTAATTSGFKAAFAEAHRLGPACAVASATTRGTGTVQLTEASATHFSGHVDVTFDDGDKLQGDFSVATCSGSTADICQIVIQVVSGNGTSLCAGGPSCQ
jgi:hypothetical protein